MRNKGNGREKGKKRNRRDLKKNINEIVDLDVKSEEMGKGARLREIGGNGTIL